MTNIYAIIVSENITSVYCTLTGDMEGIRLCIDDHKWTIELPEWGFRVDAFGRFDFKETGECIIFPSASERSWDRLESYSEKILSSCQYVFDKTSLYMFKVHLNYNPSISSRWSKIYSSEDECSKALEEYKKSIEPKYEPYTSSEAFARVFGGSMVKHKASNSYRLVSEVNTQKPGDPTYRKTPQWWFDNYVTMDGEPLGKKIS